MYIDHRGKTVPSHIALDASGQLRAGFRRASEVLADGERFSFDIMTMDARTAPATNTVFLTDVIKPLDPAAVVSAIRDARYTPAVREPVARNDQGLPTSNAPTLSMADNSHVASALRTARFH